MILSPLVELVWNKPLVPFQPVCSLVKHENQFLEHLHQRSDIKLKSTTNANISCNFQALSPFEGPFVLALY